MPFNQRLTGLFLEIAGVEGISGRERRVADYISGFLKGKGFLVEEDEAGKVSGGDAGNLICRYGSGGEIMLLAHMDTVSSTAELKAQVHSDRITSDGSTILGSDDRAGVTAILYAVEKLLSGGGGIRDFTGVFTVDEERNLIGSRHLKPPEKIRMCVVFDSHSRPGNYITRTYGCREFHVKVRGRASHAGIAPEKGVNSIQIASSAISRLKLGRVGDDTTANIGVIRGGSAMNVVPEMTEIKGEVRSLAMEKVDSLISDIEKEFQTAAANLGGKVEFHSQWAFQPYNITANLKVRKVVENALRGAGLEPQPSTTAGGSDANNLNAKGIPSINLGIGAQNPHSVEEFILLEDLQAAAEIAMNLIRRD